MPYLLPLFVLMLRMTGALGAAHSASDFAAEDFARSTGDPPPALGWCGRHDHARAVAQAVCAVDQNPLTDRHAGIDRCHWAIGRTDTLLSALMT
jgi:hypothetical protein